MQVAGVIRERFRRFVPASGWILRAGDVLLLRGEPGDLERLVARGRLMLAGGGEERGAEATVVEGVVTASSSAIGRTPRELGLAEKYGIGVLAVSRSGQRIGQRLMTVRLQAGDVVVLRSASKLLPEALGELRILPLAEHSIALGRSHRSWVPLAVLAAAMALVVVQCGERGDRVLRRGRGVARSARAVDGGGLRDGGVAPADPARRADPAEPRHQDHRRLGADRQRVAGGGGGICHRWGRWRRCWCW